MEDRNLDLSVDFRIEGEETQSLRSPGSQHPPPAGLTMGYFLRDAYDSAVKIKAIPLLLSKLGGFVITSSRSQRVAFGPVLRLRLPFSSFPLKDNSLHKGVNGYFSETAKALSVVFPAGLQI